MKTFQDRSDVVMLTSKSKYAHAVDAVSGSQGYHKEESYHYQDVS